MNTQKIRFARKINSMFRRGGTLVVLASILILFPMVAFGATVDLAWDANTEPDLDGYKIYYGTASGNYSPPIDVGNTTQHTLTGLNDGVTYYLAATAYDLDGNESAYSVELVHTTAIANHTITASAGANGSISPSGSVTVNHGSSQTFTISADANYHVQDVLVNGVSVGAVTSYPFTNVTQNHTVHVIFAGDKHPPVADAGSDQAVYVNDSVQLDGSSSSDVDGDALTFQWSITSTPSGSSAVLSDATLVNPVFVVDVAGSYIVQLIVNDGTSNSDPDTVIISTENSLPVADAGSDQAVYVNDSVQLDGSSSSDVDGDALTFQWSITSTPSGSSAVLSDATLVNPVFVVDVAGSYIVQLIVNDGTSNSDPDTVIISTENSLPVADAGSDQAVYVNDSVQLDGSSSSDVDGDALTFQWSITSTPSGSSAVLSDATLVNPVFVVDVAGSYIVQLIVNDGTSNSDPDTVIISTENSLPVADAGSDQAVYVNDSVQLDGSSSSDVDGDALTFQWSITSTPSGSSAVLSDATLVNPVFVVDVAGSYIVQLIVNDGTSNSDPDTVIISTENSLPVADAGSDQAVYVNDSVQLDGSSSSDVDGDALTFQWSITSTPSGSSAVLSDATLVNPSFVVDVAGSYIVQLIVNDGTSNSDPDTVIISTENSLPVADAGSDQAVYVNDSVQLDGSSSSDVDGDALTFQWSITSTPSGSSAVLSDATLVNPVFVVDVAGSYIVQLIVNDGTSNSDPDTVIISTENSLPVADAGSDQAVYVNDSVQLDGSSSSDVDGDALTFQWSITSTPSGSSAVLSDATLVNPVFVVDVAGSYIVQLIVNDGTSNSDPDTVIISTENSLPVADAGSDQAVYVNDSVQLDGSSSSDVDGDALTFQWSITSTPSGSSAVLSDATLVNPVFVVDVAGSYIVQLIVNDGTSNSDPDTVIISTENSLPVADAGSDQAVYVNDSVQLDGSSSSDVDGDALTFQWSITSTPSGSSAVLSDATLVNPVFVVDVAGSYIVQLIVNDGTSNSDPDTVIISTENSLPVADAGSDQAVYVNDSVQLDGSSSSDVDGDALTFQWSITSTPSGSSAVLSDATLVNPVFVVDVAGSYIVQLIVNDGTSNSDPDTVIISTENSLPVADAGSDQAVYVNDSVQLDGSSSSDVDGDALTFQWSITSTPSGSSAVLSDATLVNPVFVVDVAGSYIVQLIVNDGTSNSDPDTVIISTENSPPAADAGDDQTVEEGDVVALDGFNSTDPNDNITSYSWTQTGGATVNLTNPDEVEATFIAPVVGTDPEMLTFKLTVIDAEGLQDIDTCSVYVTKEPVIDSDGDGVPDDEDAFPFDPDEHLDTDGDGEGNNADTDDDNDGMPDTWELLYGLDPLKDDAAEDPDGDEVSNIDEYNLGTEPNNNEGNFEPYPPSLIAPDDHETVGLTPQLESGEFDDPNINDVHSQTQWKIVRVHDEFCVLDITTSSSLTSLKVPKLILEDDLDYRWQVKYIDNQGGASAWSDAGYFTTEFLELDADGNGVLDHQEVDTTIDLDQDGIMDRDQDDIKCVATETGDFKIGVSIRQAVNADSIVSIQSEAPGDTELHIPVIDGPNFLAFGLIHFKLFVKQPGDEVSVTIYLSKAAYDDGIWYKYDPVNDQWFDYSDFIDFSADRKAVQLTLTDGGFGDADGIENGVIVDPLALGTVTDHGSGSGSDNFVEDIADSFLSELGCFISAADPRSADRHAFGLWRDIRGSDLFTIFILMMLAYIGKEIFLRIRQYRRIGLKTSLMEGWRNS